MEVSKRVDLDALAYPKVYALDAQSQKHVHDLCSLPGKELIRLGSFEVLKNCSGELYLQGPNSPFTPGVTEEGELGGAAEKFRTTYAQAARHLMLDSLRSSGQLNYLQHNADELINSRYRVVIDVDIYRNRGFDRVKMHRDSLGYTMFFNLMYDFERARQPPLDETQGPEFLMNPPVDQKRFAELKKLMPPLFIQDLEHQYKVLPSPTQIQTVKVPRGHAVGALDEACFHSTPYPWRRGKVYDLYEVQSHWREALVETEPKLVAQFDQWKNSFLGEEFPNLPELVRLEGQLMNLMREKTDAHYSSLDEGAVKKMLAEFPRFAESLARKCAGPNPFLEAAVPGAGAYPAKTVPLAKDLKRQLSDELPSSGVKVQDRPDFVRTWVMGVKK
ncbi:hypothetical protein [Piscinibacter sp. XHJ-5]|uniref:hypothetical protein n=1 Tax=Piscinibacter sp. XHJ-5 TaxID=3037797 RepID=UPI002453696E|nr:hypothetical protein [Piscinibacter sp. XHJ-5]